MDILEINKALLDGLHEQARESERLRMNRDLRTSADDGWKSRVRLTPEGEVALTPENEFLLTPKEPWPVGSFLFRLTCLLLSFACSHQ